MAKQRDFRDDYRELFARLGHRLTNRQGIPEAQLAKSAAKLGIQLPSALLDYYLVAGREQHLNQVFNKLRSPNGWEMHSGNLIFMDENQAVVAWGVPAGAHSPQDQPVFQAPRGPIGLTKWYPEHINCSGFLKFSLHLQAAYGGGMPFAASAPAPADFAAILKHGWFFAGEVGDMFAYSRDHCAVCVAKWRDFGEQKKTWRVFAGSTTRKGLQTIADEFKVELKP